MNNPEIFDNGDKYWYDDKGKFHRDNDLPAIVWIGNVNCWYFHGKRHRTFGINCSIFTQPLWTWLGNVINDE